MKKQLVFLIMALLFSFYLQAQYNYTQVTSGLTDVYESGSSLFGLGDIYNDGDIDIISVGDHWGGVVSNEIGIMVFKNNGDGTAWTKTMSGIFGYGGVVVGDVNNDGMLDVAYGIHHNYSTTMLLSLATKLIIMSTFNTYSVDNNIFGFFLRYSRMLNFLLFLLFVFFIGLFDIIHIALVLSLIILFIIFSILFERYLRRIKTNGTLELTTIELNWTSENNNIKIDKEKIEKIIIVRESLRSIISQDFKIVLFDIICKDNSLKHFIVKKYSIDKDEFDITESLKVFSKINGIIFYKKKYIFGC